MAKQNVRKQILEAKTAIKELMQENLAVIAENMIDQIIGKAKRLTPSQQLDAIKDIEPRGQAEYKDLLLTALSVISLDAIEKARKEVPAAKKVRLSEFDRLPPALQRKIKSQSNLLVGTQIGDLSKNLFFQYQSSLDSTDDPSLIGSDITDSATEYITGPSIEAGSGVIASQVVNSARNAFFFDDDVLEEIDAFEFVNGDPVTEICKDLNGTVFSKDDPEADRYYPPLHWNCKSYIRPILKGNLGNKEIEKLRPSKSKLEDQIKFAEEGHVHVVCGEIDSPRPGSLQTVVVAKSHAKSVDEAKAIAKDFGATHLTPDETDSSYRFRQRNPEDFVEGSFRTKAIDAKGVSLIYGRLKS